MKKGFLIGFLVFVLSGLVVAEDTPTPTITETVTETVTPTITPTFTVTPTITPNRTDINRYAFYGTTSKQSGYEIIYSGECWLAGWSVNSVPGSAVGDTINVYSAGKTADFIESNYIIPIGVLSHTDLPKASPPGIFGSNDRKWLYHLPNGLGVSKTATNIEATFWIYKR